MNESRIQNCVKIEQTKNFFKYIFYILYTNFTYFYSVNGKTSANSSERSFHLKSRDFVSRILTKNILD